MPDKNLTRRAEEQQEQLLAASYEPYRAVKGTSACIEEN
jgi:hypothetical protein